MADSGFDFDAYTSLYHPKLDSWGIATGTRVWMASGSFKPAARIEEGEDIFGVTYRPESVHIADSDLHGPIIKSFWRPRLVHREVLAVRSVTGVRSWQLTFGDYNQQHDTRRLVAGADTTPDLCPVAHDANNHTRLVELQTALKNPRVETQYRRAEKLDPEWSEQAGRPMYRPTEHSGTPRGDLLSIIPYSAYGGQAGLFDTRTRSYQRYTFKQVREVVVLQESATLIQLYVKPDLNEDQGVLEGMPPRANIIAQTPFAPETEETKMYKDKNAAQATSLSGKGKESIENFERFADQWDSYVDQGRRPQTTQDQEVKHSRDRQGVFHKTASNEDIARDLQRYYGIEGGFLDGGILLRTPVLDKFKQ